MRSYSGRYVHFTDGGICVDIARYLRSEAGRIALDRIERSSERFRRSRQKEKGNVLRDEVGSNFA